jgi:hypothetical protein
MFTCCLHLSFLLFAHEWVFAPSSLPTLGFVRILLHLPDLLYRTSTTLTVRHHPQTLAVIILFMAVTAVKRSFAKKTDVDPKVRAFVEAPFVNDEGVSLFSSKSLAGLGLRGWNESKLLCMCHCAFWHPTVV